MKFILLWLGMICSTALCVFIASVETNIARFCLEALVITGIIAWGLRPFTPRY